MAKFSDADVGCWFDGARGIYIGAAVIDLAEEHGFKVPNDYTEEDRTPDGEFYDELYTEAEDYLQDLAPDGCYFGTSEAGDWGLWETEPDNWEYDD